jgi:protein-S-isoprenylcysteine O-methyltransferase Ste14
VAPPSNDMKKYFYLIIVLVLYTAIAVLMFGLAGRIDLPFFWSVIALQGLVGIISPFVVDPDLISERMKPRGKDKDPSGRLVLSALYVVHLCIAALDVGRLRISDTVPLPLQLMALAASALGWAGLLWTMTTNRYFSSAIRIQKDRGQTVITKGPYKYVRHPGYAFATLAFLSQGIALGSWLSLVPMVICVSALIRRTRMEESLLTEQLPGYKDYAKIVRYRWCPGIW